MDIKFRCPGVSRFDDATGKYETCNQLLQVPANRAGSMVRCPRCNHKSAVPGGDNLSKNAPQGSNGNGDKLAVNPDPGLAYGTFDRSKRCPKCGALLDAEKKCSKCHFQSEVINPNAIPLEQMKVKRAGFQLWLSTIMTDKTAFSLFQTALHSFVFIVVLGLCIYALTISGPNVIAFFSVAALVGAFYVIAVIQTKRMATTPAARLPFYYRPFWFLLLLIARSQKWVGYDSRLKGRKVIDVRGQPFGDRDLLDIPDLNLCEVLDAEGTDITDNALTAMHSLRKLKCLVVRKTHVSNEAVFRLQQRLPECWIWH